jgi:sulfur carrier protein
MNVIMNGEPVELADGATTAAAVQRLTSAVTGIAVAVNGEVVRRGDWESTRLSDGDQVEVLTAVQGG